LGRNLVARLNDSQSRHGNRSETYAGGLIVHYNQFSTATPADVARIEKVKSAVASIDRLDRKVGLTNACNVYFSHLPKGRTFHQLWQDNRIFINYSPSGVPGLFASTHSNDRDLAVTRWCIDKHNPWMIGATIVHEFGHIGGAPGGSSHGAEAAVRECGFGPQYDPTILGSLRSLAGVLQQFS
jgi:hypothetical protein